MFIYSPRPGTPAANLPDGTPHAEKCAASKLSTKSSKPKPPASTKPCSAPCNAAWSKAFPKKDPDQLQARTANNRVVNFTGGPNLINQMVDLEITEAFTFSLRGRLPADA